jgi:hypothetical protein
MEARSDFYPYLAVWAALIAGLVGYMWRSRRGSAGLVLGYVFQLWMYYWVGGLIHSFPWSELPQSDLVFLGFQQATWALLAFLAGAALARGIFRRQADRLGRLRYEADPKLPRAYMFSGVFSYFVLLPTLGRLPSLNALTAVGQQLIVVGFALQCWLAWQRGKLPVLARQLGYLALLPAVTVLGQGFLGYGVMAASTVLIFVAQFFRPRWALIATGSVAAYVGLSFYIAYMAHRTELRASVWGGEELSSRVDRLKEMLASVEPFDFQNPVHLETVDGRVNQAGLVGAAVWHLSATGDYAHGSTVWDALIGVIPRIIWLDKLIVAGSMGYASRFTGMTFAEGTSVGMGQVMEFYGNFGEAGVWIGFFAYGVLVGALDLLAVARLAAGDWQGFAYRFLVGIAFLNASGSLFEVSTSAAAGAVLMRIVNTVLHKYQRMRERHRQAALAPPVSG